jgi:hypothetical protein
MRAVWDKDRRRAKKLARELSSSDPTGTKWVAVPTEQTESWYLGLCNQAAARVDEPVAKWVDLAQHISFSDTVRNMRGEARTEGTHAQHEAAYVSSKLGYQLRIVEFTDLDLEDNNDELADVMRQMFGEKRAGAGWFENVCGTASMLMRVLEKEPDGPAGRWLAPIGAGREMHMHMCLTLVNSVLTTPDGVRRNIEGITFGDLTHAWRYGYYLRACEMSLPDEGRTALAEIAP